MKVAVFGARGRMGVAICEAVEASDDLQLVAALDAGDDRDPATAADVVVDFTVPDAVLDNIAWCVETGVHAVVGTTGIAADDHETVALECAEHPAHLPRVHPKS